MCKKQSNIERYCSYVLLALVVMTALYRYALPTRDGDIWFHLLYGKYFIENLTLIPDHTVFSWTPSTNDYIYCTWFSDIILFLIHAISGLPGLFTFRYMSLGVVIYLCYLEGKKIDLKYLPVLWFSCLLFVFLSYTAIAEKPELFSYLFFMIYCWLWWSIVYQDNSSAITKIYMYPLIMLFWVNSHGGFLFGCVFIFVANVSNILNKLTLKDRNERANKTEGHFFIASILSLLAILITPYGVSYPIQLFQEFFLADSNFANSSNIAAYVSPFAQKGDVYGFALIANIAVFILILLLLINIRKIEWSTILLNLVFLLIYSQYYRTTFYWAGVFLFSIAYMMKIATDFSGPNEKTGGGRANILLVLCGITLSIFFFYRSFARPELHLWMGFGISESNAQDEVNYVIENFPDEKIGNTYNVGSYLMWRGWPKHKVFVDARYFPYRDWIDEKMVFNQGEPLNQFFKENQASVWIVDFINKSALNWFNRSEDWALIYYGKSAAVFVRKDIPRLNLQKQKSENIHNLQNIGNSVYALVWAINQRDWDTVNIILSAMEERFRFFPNERSIVRDAVFFSKATKAYYSGDYVSAVKYFRETKKIAAQNDRMFANSLIHLAIEAWDKGNKNEARTFNREAWEIYPQDINIYNAAVMNWIESISNPDDISDSYHGEETIKKNELWKIQLEEFLKVAPENAFFNKYIQDAQRVLNNEKEIFLNFCIPPLVY